MADRLVVKSDYTTEQVDTLRLLALLTGHDVELVKMDAPQIRITDFVGYKEENLAGLKKYSLKVLFLTYPEFDFKKVVSDERRASVAAQSTGVNMVLKTLKVPDKPDYVASMVLWQASIDDFQKIGVYVQGSSGVILLGDGKNIESLNAMKRITPYLYEKLGTGARIVYAVDNISLTDKRDEIGTMCKIPVNGGNIDCVLVDLTTEKNSFNTALELLVSKIL